jgi:hypothetical protein
VYLLQKTFPQPFHRNINADLVAIPEAIHNRSSWIGDGELRD